MSKEYKFFRVGIGPTIAMSDEFMQQLAAANQLFPVIPGVDPEFLEWGDWKPISVSVSGDEVIVMAERETR